MASAEPTGSCRTIRDRLEASRRRLTLKQSLEGGARSALAAAAVYALLTLTAYLAGVWPWVPLVSGRAAGAAAATVLLLGALATLIHVRKARPTLLQVARDADRYFGLDERLSTALEFGLTEAAPAPLSPVLRELFRDAAARADQLRPEALVPLSPPRAVWYAVAIVLALVTLDIASPVPDIERAPSVAATAPTAADTETMAEMLREAAALLRQEAETRRSDYMWVVANALEKLALDIVEQGLSGADLGEEVDQMIAHARLAVRTETVSRTDLASLAMAGTQAMPRELTSEGADFGGEGNHEPAEPGTTSTLTSSTELEQALVAIESFRSTLDGESRMSEQLAEVGPSSPGDENIDAEIARAELARLRAQRDRDRELANIELDPPAVGDQGLGESGTPHDGAGAGTLAGSPDGTPLPEASSSRDFELAAEGGSRRRLPVEIVPETRFSSVFEAPVAGGDWRKTAEQQVSSDLLSISYRGVASRYFLSLTQEQPRLAP